MEVLILFLLLVISDRLWRLLDTTKKHQAAVEALLTDLRDRAR